MESLNRHVSTLLLTAALAVILVSAGSFWCLVQFQEIQEGFDTELPLWLSWVFPTFRYWAVIGIALFLMFLFSLRPNIKYSRKFNGTAVSVAILGYMSSVAFIVFSVLAIFWPVVQNAQQDAPAGQLLVVIFFAE